MPRPLETPGAPLDERLYVPVSRKMIEHIDVARGDRTRARYVRDLIRADARTRTS